MIAGIPTDPIQLHLDNSLGAGFIGLIVAAMWAFYTYGLFLYLIAWSLRFFGVTNVQTLIYYQSSFKDPFYLKFVVSFVFPRATIAPLYWELESSDWISMVRRSVRYCCIFYSQLSTLLYNRLLDALHLALISHILYIDMVTNFMNPAIISVPSWSLCVSVFSACRCLLWPHYRHMLSSLWDHHSVLKTYVDSICQVLSDFIVSL